MKIWKKKNLIIVVVVFLLLTPLTMAIGKDDSMISQNKQRNDEEESMSLNDGIDQQLPIDNYGSILCSAYEWTQRLYLQENLAPNPSFEYSNGSLPDGWEHTSSHYVKFVWDSAYAHTGVKSVGITNIKAAHIGANWYTIKPIPIDPINNTYAFGVWYKYYAPPPQYNGGYMGITGLDKNGQQVGVTWILYLPYVDNEWHYFQYICNPYFNQSMLEEIKYVRLYLCYVTGKEVNSSEGIRFDDVFFGKGEFPVIEIGDIRGFFGTISITVRNVGNVDAENIPWAIRIVPVAGKIFTDEIAGGVIDKLPVGTETKIKSNFIFGFGSAIVLITVGEEYERLGLTIVGPLLIKMP